MNLALTLVAAVGLAAISLELVRNRNYEDGVLGRFALWAIFFCALARATQILDSLFVPYLGGGGISSGMYLDNVETTLWVGVLLFMARHLYRFRRALTDESYTWRPSVK